MKATAQQVFTCTLELDYDEAQSLKEALQVIAEIQQEDLEENDISKNSWKRVKNVILPELERALDQRNWRE